MSLNIDKLSSCESVNLSCGIDNIFFKKYTRYFDGGYKMNFYDALSGVIDYKYKNYTDFYLTKNHTLNSVIDSDINDLEKTSSVATKLNFGGNFLGFVGTNVRPTSATINYLLYNAYGQYDFSTTSNKISSTFVIDFKNSNVCNIYHIYDYEKYYLSLNSDNQLNFYSKSANVSSIDFNYIYSKPNKSIFLFCNVNDKPNFVKKVSNSLTLVESTSTNKLLIYNNPIILDKDIYTETRIVENTTFIEYDNNNMIAKNGIVENLNNNLLLHKTNDLVDIMVLKNQLSQDDIFTNGNNLLSASNSKFFIEDMREYTSIFNDIDSEKDETLSLNYVFYNKSYYIKSGKNVIVAPTSLLPYTQLNINDAKFLYSGAFSYTTPKYADKVFRKDKSISYDDGQFYLCTWLSGYPLANNGVWVDRYYYPDLIDKENALNGKNTFNLTYEDVLENLVKANTNLTDTIEKYSFFDKKSDMVFVPNGEYIYDRIDITKFEDDFIYKPIINTKNSKECNVDTASDISPNINYYRKVNESGKLTMSFYFNGDANNWELESGRSSIDAGVRIIKNNNSIQYQVSLYDTSTKTFTLITHNEPFIPVSLNFVSLSIDVIRGIGYFYMNSKVVYSFKFQKNNFFTKQILFDDFTVKYGTSTSNNSVLNDESIYFDTNPVLSDNTPIINFSITDDYIDEELFILNMLFQKGKQIDDMVITLPCGMRNSEDNVEFLQSICDNHTFKSNHVNLYVKNTDLDQNLSEKIKKEIQLNISSIVPITTELNNINLENYK